LRLSDGARIDYFRRQNLEINNEQVLAAYYIGPEKIKDAQAKFTTTRKGIFSNEFCKTSL
jgi:hypothetical protein